MAYRLTYGSSEVHGRDGGKVRSGTLSGGVNTFSTLEFKIYPDNPMYAAMDLCDMGNPVRLYWDSDLLFKGYIEEVQQSFDLGKTFRCKSMLAVLERTIVPHYAYFPRGYDDSSLSKPPGGSWHTITDGLAYFLNRLVYWHNDAVNLTYGGVTAPGGAKVAWSYPSSYGSSLASEASKIAAKLPVAWSQTGTDTTLGDLLGKVVDVAGAHLYVTGFGDTTGIALYASVPAAMRSGQTVELGSNIVEVASDTSASPMYTAILPTGRKGDYEVSLKSGPAHVNNGRYSGDLYVDREVMFDAVKVRKYGFRLYAWEDKTAQTAGQLARSAAAKLRQVSNPLTSVSVKAIDMAVMNPGAYRHLKPGEVVRVRSAPHGINADMVLEKTAVDFVDPGRTRYTLGLSSNSISSNICKLMSPYKGSM